jgi:hypothetical protein
MIRAIIGMIAAFAGLVLMLQDAPRVLFDFQHADEFVEARGLEITDAQCTNWNLGMFDHCEIDYQSSDRKQSGQLDDWRFGSAPTGLIHLMQWRDNPAVVTTDVSLDTVTGRLVFVVTLVVGSLLLVFGVAKKMMQRMRPRYQVE